MGERSKPVKNQLFTASVTGATYEDFSQNAILLPAKEIVPIPSTNIPTVIGKPEGLQGSAENVNPPTSTLFAQAQSENTQLSVAPQFSKSATFDNISQNLIQPPPNSTDYPYFNQKNLPPLGTSASSSFDNFVHTAPPNFENFSHQSSQSVPFLPANPNFNASTNQSTPGAASIPLASHSTNTYRRSAAKKPTYAQLPGLVSVNPSQPPPSLEPPSQTSSQISPSVVGYLQPVANPHSLLIPTPTTIHNPVPTSSAFLDPITPEEGLFAAPVSSSSAAHVFSHPSPQAIPSMVVPDNGVPPPNDLTTPISSATSKSQMYRPVYHHWFYKRVVEGKTLWQPLSMVDSLALEDAFTSIDMSPEREVATDGGRYDVNVLRRERYPVYWESPATEVRRCSWFHKGSADGRFTPYEENIAAKLEEEYRLACDSNAWHRKVVLASGETVVMHAPDVLVLLPPAPSPDAWGNTPQTQPKPKVVKRGMDEFDIDEGEPAKVDHLLFLVHGIGSVCDLKFRTVTEVVDEFRNISLQLVTAHYRNSCENGKVNRVEVLPISWHSKLHSEDTGIDKTLKSITLESIPRLRDFTNDTLLDILFYTSPIYCQTIISTVGDDMNRLYDLFKKRNPSFTGNVSLGGHSLGSLIVFDLLCHQHPEPEKEIFTGDEDIVPPLKKTNPKDRRLSRRISYMMSEAGTGQPQLIYPHLTFQPSAFFALGSPIGMFVTVRGLDTLGEEFSLPTCPAFFNIFHPYDPVAYRIESLINPQLSGLKPVLIPHHKGRKRMHLELRETMARVGADLKQKLVDSMKNTWNSFFQLGIFGRQDAVTSNLEEEVNKVVDEKLAEEALMREEEECFNNYDEQKVDLNLGILNKGRRIDYVLQEAPLEFFNEYIFALTSHVCYWESEDTMLMILKEIYSSMGISTDDQLPAQTMTIERHSFQETAAFRSHTSQPEEMGMNPTMPMARNVQLGPPPTTGFVRNT